MIHPVYDYGSDYLDLVRVALSLTASLSAGLLLLGVCAYTLTLSRTTSLQTRTLICTRLSLSIPAIAAFWDFGFGHLRTPEDILHTGISRQVGRSK